MKDMSEIFINDSFGDLFPDRNSEFQEKYFFVAFKYFVIYNNIFISNIISPI